MPAFMSVEREVCVEDEAAAIDDVVDEIGAGSSIIDDETGAGSTMIDDEECITRLVNDTADVRLVRKTDVKVDVSIAGAVS